MIVSICFQFLLASIAFAVNANIISIFSNDNTPPNPPVIIGLSSGKIREKYIYSVKVSDPDEEDLLIKIHINFGDKIIEGRGCDGLRLKHSGAVQEFEHSWKKTETLGTTRRVQDDHGEWSEWSEPLLIMMPYSYNPMQQFFG